MGCGSESVCDRRGASMPCVCVYRNQHTEINMKLCFSRKCDGRPEEAAKPSPSPARAGRRFQPKLGPTRGQRLTELESEPRTSNPDPKSPTPHGNPKVSSSRSVTASRRRRPSLSSSALQRRIGTPTPDRNLNPEPISKAIGESQRLKANGAPHWWHLREASCLAVGVVTGEAQLNPDPDLNPQP